MTLQGNERWYTFVVEASSPMADKNLDLVRFPPCGLDIPNDPTIRKQLLNESPA